MTPEGPTRRGGPYLPDNIVLHPLVWITCEPITYFMLNGYDRVSVPCQTIFVLRLFKYNTKKLNTRARQYLYDAGETLQV